MPSLQAQTPPSDAWKNGAAWPTSLQLAIPSDWSPGAYAYEVDDGDGIVPGTFVVREPHQTARLLLLYPNHTDQAYNEWGGHSYYSASASPVVALERPLLGKIEYYAAAVHLLRWLSREGIPFAMGNDDDLAERPEYVDRYPAVAVVGHSEYWTRPMRVNLERTLARGGAVLVLGGNVCWWQSRLELDAGVRRLVCYKYEAAHDPYQRIDPSLDTTYWDEPPLNEPANLFLGLSWREGGMVNYDQHSYCPCDYDWLLGYGGYRSAHTDHWAFEGTGLAPGDQFGRDDAIVGYEVDGTRLRWDEGEPSVTGEGGTSPGFVVLGTSPCWNEYNADTTGVAVMGIEERNGGFVFHGGTIGWAFGLEHDRAVQTLTRNLLRHAIARDALAPLVLDLSVMPNPTRDELVVTGDLPTGTWRGSPPRIRCYDASGRKIDTLLGSVDLGARFIARWNPRRRGLPGGVYWLEVGHQRTRAVLLPR